jgi:hypothetical protein
LVARRKEGLNVLYRLDDPVVEKICHLVETIFEELEAQAKLNRKVLKRKGSAE